jgi:hypothetical protein
MVINQEAKKIIPPLVVATIISGCSATSQPVDAMAYVAYCTCGAALLVVGALGLCVGHTLRKASYDFDQRQAEIEEEENKRKIGTGDEGIVLTTPKQKDPQVTIILSDLGIPGRRSGFR